MADHVRWVTAAEPSLGWEPRSYEALFAKAQDAQMASAAEGVVWLPHLADLVRENGGAYDGTATELLRALLKRADASPKDFGWPRSPKGMADALTRYAPLLRATGITHRTVPDRHAKTDRHHFSTDGDAGDAGVAAPSVPGMEEEREGGEVAIPLGKTATPATPATPAKTNPMDDLGLKADLPPTSPHLDHTPCPPDLYRAHIQDVYRDPNGPGWICPAGCAYPTGDASAALVN